MEVTKPGICYGNGDAGNFGKKTLMVKLDYPTFDSFLSNFFEKLSKINFAELFKFFCKLKLFYIY